MDIPGEQEWSHQYQGFTEQRFGHFYGGSPDPIPTMKIAGCHLSKWSRTHM